MEAEIKFPNGATVVLRNVTASDVLAIANPPPSLPPLSDENLRFACRAICAGGNRVEAIRLARGARNWGLKEAKDWVDANFPRESCPMG